jgi:hypothetical protein
VRPRLAVVALLLLGTGFRLEGQIVRDSVRRDTAQRVPGPGQVTSPGNAPAKPNGRRPGDSSKVDPARMAPIDRAQYEQDAFEEFRHHNLPMAESPQPKNCEEMAGRFCYFYNERERIPPELVTVTAARTKLLGILDSLGRLMPRELWIAQVRVRYLAEVEKFDDALKVARACGDSWRCEILEGFSLHMLEKYDEAEQVYDRALSKMPARERCDWTNIQYLLDDVALGQFRNMRCDDPKREPWVNRALFLSRNMYSMNGNDSRTEFFARMTMAQMFTDARSPHQFGFDTDEREMLLRFGWARWWTGTLSFPLMIVMQDSKGDENSGTGPGTPGPVNPAGQKGKGKGGTSVGSYPPGITIPKSVPKLERPPDLPGTRGIPQGAGGGVPDARPSFPRLPMPTIQQRPGDLINVFGIEPFPAYRYIPAAYVLNSPLVADSSEWRPQPPPVFARYAPPYAKKLVSLEHQQAVFKRGDSALVVLAYNVKGVREMQNSPLRAGLVVTPVGDQPVDYKVVNDELKDSGVLTVRAPWTQLLMSAEVAAPANKALARARYGVGPLNGPPTRIVLSDILFYRGYGAQPSTVEDAAAHALTTERMRASDKLGVYWESYGTNPTGEKLKVSLSVDRTNPDGGGFFRRLVGRSGRGLVSVSIDDISALGKTTSSRGLELDISTLSAGSYVVQLEIEVPGHLPLRAERRIEVVGR